MKFWYDSLFKFNLNRIFYILIFFRHFILFETYIAFFFILIYFLLSYFTFFYFVSVFILLFGPFQSIKPKFSHKPHWNQTPLNSFYLTHSLLSTTQWSIPYTQNPNTPSQPTQTHFKPKLISNLNQKNPLTHFVNPPTKPNPHFFFIPFNQDL